VNTPKDIYDHVVSAGKEADFLTAIAMHRRNYSIAELPDAVFDPAEGALRLRSKLYKLDIPIEDSDIAGAAEKGQYISAFLCRHEEQYQLHFLVHPWAASEKAAHEEELTRNVVQFMILRAIITLRLTTWRKVDEYLAG